MNDTADSTQSPQLTGAAGLTQEEARRRLAAEGPNDLPSAKRPSLLALVLEVVREPMFGLLLAAGGIYALIGDLAEAAVLMLFASISVFIAIIQRGRSERVLEALRDMASPRALVVRDGEERRIAGRDVVRGDLLVLEEGDRIPADALLVTGTDVRVAEAMLTGESVPVRKQAALQLPESGIAPGGEDSPMLYAGTLLVSGTARAQVLATGVHSEMGKLGRSLQAIEQEVPRLQLQTRRLVKIFATAGLLLAVLAVLLYGFTRGDWIEALLGGIALGMSMLPEEFPLVLTVFMAMGAWRLSRSRVLARRATAIETLGAATVFCTDKTGTLTQNAMTVTRLVSGAETWRTGSPTTQIADSRPLAGLLEAASLASDPEGHDPMDQAVCALAKQVAHRTRTAPVRVYPLRRELLAVTQVHVQPDGASFDVCAKGAPEAIARLCGMTAEQRAALLEQVDQLAQQGIRILAVARATLPKQALPEEATQLTLQFAGLVGYADPLRESVPAAVRECREAGIRVVMITGDYPLTAQAIAREAGIEDGDCISGPELDGLTDAALAGRVRAATVFARITPRQKLRIVEAFKAAGEVVAMTGDGVNDAPALKAAHIGIAMGGRGTDVAREASSLVLLDDDFGSVVRAIRLGRRIFDNLRKAMGYILAVHVPIAGLALLPVLIGAPLVLTPMLIAMLELIIDPACSIVLEAEHAERNVMRRPPRDPQAPLLSRSGLMWNVAQGVIALLLVAGIYVHALQRGLPEDEVRMSAFLALVSANVALLLANRGFGVSLRAVLGGRNPPLWWGLGFTTLLLCLLVTVPVARDFFHIAPPEAAQMVLSLAAGPVVLLLLQALKAARNVAAPQS